MNKNITYIRVLLGIISLVVVLAFVNRAPRHVPGSAWLPSSYNPVGAGNMAFFQTLQEMNWPVERWRDPLSQLSAYGTGNVLIVTRAKSRSPVDFTEQEIDLLNEWVKRGNTLLLLGNLNSWDDTRLLLKSIGFKLFDKDDAMSDFFTAPLSSEKPSIELQSSDAGPDRLVVPASKPLPLGIPRDAHILWQQQGLPYIVDVPCGQGHIICGASASLLANSCLSEGDNLTHVLALIAPGGRVPGHIFFEESHHGFTAVYAVGRLLNDPGVQFAGMLALLGGLAFLGSALVRFGPIIPLQRESGRSTLEFVDSIADLYLHANVWRDTLNYLFKETHQSVLHRLNLPPSATHELIASRLQQINPQLPKWKKLAQRFDSPDYIEGLPPTGWLRVARELIEIKSAMA